MTAYANLAGLEVGDGFPVRLVGAINVSPESFYQGSVAEGEASLRQKAEQMAAEGADGLDIGAMSTAPYLQTEVTEAEEIQRLTWAIGVVRKVTAVPISADTTRSRVALAALDAGAGVINDVSGLRHDPGMAEIVARRARGVILMATETEPEARDPIGTVRRLLEESLQIIWKAGVPEHRVVVDPGIGFFRKAVIPWHAWDCEVLRRLGDLRTLEHPVLVGLSRKSFIGHILGQPDPADRLAGSLATTAIAVMNGAHLIRTHDVGPTREAVRMAEALRPG
ncbi:MAG: dihydropteroate synthase [candidate division NC10 bacterium]|nr:dihydropteroate synthase [candidate division NC10 bacterium]MBI2163863.1 dihydropteroate synthase [candidate division NC10 bacterium]MBI2456731.1 dihydropteroate synthase [candidate division NC10 bacterium]MBI2919383.1 dihydropteroate synthase [Chloroflexota bacterium]MBI3086147.1 dihydropteroate synthase [candidate division NC10 bacterium]